MRIAIAPTAFRGSLTAQEAIEYIGAGLKQSALSNFETIPMPLADGGDGTLDILLNGLGGVKLPVGVSGPDESPVEAYVGLLADRQTAVIEMASASGIELLRPELRKPGITTTYGTGELILAAWQRGYRRFIIGLGGSATVDGGAGCFQALGARLLDEAGDEIAHGGENLTHLASIDASPMRLDSKNSDVTVLTDVSNLLLGPDGAARVFGPQKGADTLMVERLEQGLDQMARIMRRDLHCDVRSIPGGGAAGGFGAGLVAFLDAKLRPGAATVISLLGYENQLAHVDVVITGEGKLDSQTQGGKAVRGIAEAAQRAGIPVFALVGQLTANSANLRSMGIRSARSIVPGPCTLDEAFSHAPQWLTQAAKELGNMLSVK